MKTSQITQFATLTSAGLMILYAMINITQTFLAFDANRSVWQALSWIVIPIAASVILITFSKLGSGWIFQKFNMKDPSSLTTADMVQIIIHIFSGVVVAIALTHIVVDASYPVTLTADILARHVFGGALYVQIGVGIIGFFLPKITVGSV